MGGSTDCPRDLERQMGQRLAILLSVVGVVLIIGTLGIINTLGANIHAKQREYAILRAISITPKELRKIVITQSLLFAQVAVVLGLLAAYVMAYSFSNALSSELIIPWRVQFGIIAIVSILSFVVSIPHSYLIVRK